MWTHTAQGIGSRIVARDWQLVLYVCMYVCMYFCHAFGMQLSLGACTKVYRGFQERGDQNTMRALRADAKCLGTPTNWLPTPPNWRDRSSLDIHHF